MLRWCLPVLLLVAACPRPAPPPPPPPPAPPRPQVPEGCLEPLAGDWVHATDGTFHYSGEDDGGTVVLSVEHHLPRDAGWVPRHFGKPRDGGVDAGSRDGGLSDGGEGLVDAGLELDDDGCMPKAPSPTRIVLQRTASGFVGQTRAMVFHPSGRWCELTFKTEVLSCLDGGLTLRTEPGRALGTACEAPDEPAEEAPVVHRLIRPRP